MLRIRGEVSVSEIRVHALHIISVIICNWKWPERFFDFFAEFKHGVSEFFIVCEQTAHFWSKRCRASAGESGNIYHSLDLVIILCPCHRISKHESSFSISILYFHSQTLGNSTRLFSPTTMFRILDNIRVSVCLRANKVFSDSNRTDQVHWQIKFNSTTENRKHMARAS